jgi:3-deoxy-7-phosphoheptulonate synthase
LRTQLAQVAAGDRLLLQGGDCAELFSYCSSEPIENKLKVLLQMSLVLTWGARKPVVRIARMAGQYAKPRSKPTETLSDGREVLTFRGDNVHGFSSEERTPDPQRLVQAYFHSSATLNYVRALLSSGFADLHHPAQWDLNSVKQADVRQHYQVGHRNNLLKWNGHFANYQCT